MDLIKQIAVYGDSILKGVMLDRESQKYYFSSKGVVNNLGDLEPFQIKNYSKFGCTIKKGYQFIQKGLNKGIECDIMVLEYGGNDCDYDWQAISLNPEKNHIPNTPVDQFKAIYIKIIDELKEKGINPLMMSLPPVDAERYLTWITRDGLNRENIVKFLGDVQMIYRFQELYSNTIAAIAAEKNCLFIDVRRLFLDKHNFKDLLCDDGIHPNEAGHQLIGESIRAFSLLHAST
jgi:lysophospholipase L1-like esterase